MTVKELKKLLEQFDDDLIIEAKNDCGEYDLVETVYEDKDKYCSAGDYAEALKNKTKITWRIRKVLKIC